MTITATQVELDPAVGGWLADARLYKLSEPIHFSNFLEEGNAEYVLVSYADEDMGGPETAAFFANGSGLLVAVAPLAVLQEGNLSHVAALASAGIELATDVTVGGEVQNDHEAA